MDLASENRLEDIRKYLQKEFEFDDDDLAELFEEFFGNVTGLAAAALEQLKAGESWEEPRLIAHSMKGAAGNMGATAIHKLAQAMEQAAVAHDREEYLRFRKLLLEHLEKLKAQLDE